MPPPLPSLTGGGGGRVGSLSGPRGPARPRDSLVPGGVPFLPPSRSQGRDTGRGGSPGPGRNFDASKRSWNFPNPWSGGDWGLPDIVDYQTSGALALLTNAAKNRRYWLENFYGVNKRAVDKWDDWPDVWIIASGQENQTGVKYALRSLVMADVEVHQA